MVVFIAMVRLHCRLRGNRIQHVGQVLVRCVPAELRDDVDGAAVFIVIGVSLSLTSDDGPTSLHPTLQYIRTRSSLYLCNCMQTRQCFLVLIWAFNIITDHSHIYII